VAKKKERIEIQLDPEKDADLIHFIDENGTTRAGFIKFVLRHYMNTIKGSNPSLSSREEKQPHLTSAEPKSKKLAPKLGQAFSSKDFADEN